MRLQLLDPRMSNDVGVDPLLQRIDASPRVGEYSVVLLMADGQEQTVLLRVGADAVEVPAANLGTWAVESPSYLALVAAVRAVHEARAVAAAQRVLLQDVDGGWDVSLGNVVLGGSGQPACIEHGDLAPVGGGVFSCPDCGAQARFGDPV